MVRTGDRCVRVAGGKSSEKKGASSTSTSAAGPSSSSRSNPAIGGNPVCPRETPSWQKPITCFFTKEEGRDQKFLKKEMGESSKMNVIPNLETFPAVAGPSAEQDKEMSSVGTLKDKQNDQVEKIDNEENGVNTEEKETVDEVKEDESNAIAACCVEESEKNELVKTTEGSSDPISPSKDVNRCETEAKQDQKDESILTTPKSEKKQSSSDDCLESGSDVPAARKRFGKDLDSVDETEIPAKKCKLESTQPESNIDEPAGSAVSISIPPVVFCPNDDSDSSGFDEFTSRKRDNPEGPVDTSDDMPAKKFKPENAEPRNQQDEAASSSMFEDIKSSSDDWSAMNDSEGSEDSVVDRKAFRRVNSKRSQNGRVSPAKISDLDTTLLAIHIGDGIPVSINQDIIEICSSAENSDMDLDDSTTPLSPQNPYQYMNGSREEIVNNVVYDAPPPQDEAPPQQNNPMDLGYPGNNNQNNNNDDIPDNDYYPVENGYPEDDGSLAGNNSDDPPDDTDDEDEETEESDEDDDDAGSEEEDDDDEEDDGDVAVYANVLIYNNHIQE